MNMALSSRRRDSYFFTDSGPLSIPPGLGRLSHVLTQRAASCTAGVSCGASPWHSILHWCCSLCRELLVHSALGASE